VTRIVLEFEVDAPARMTVTEFAPYESLPEPIDFKRVED
jgi:hypothetical protein